MLLERLRAMAEPAYGDFISSLLPQLQRESILGVRTPALRKLAKQTPAEETDRLPMQLFEARQLRAFSIGQEKDFDRCIQRLNAFLPFLDNWATTDQLSPRCFGREHARLLPLAREWLRSPLPFVCRFGIVTMMNHFLGEDFALQDMEAICALRSGEYYVNMAVAWYMATALFHRPVDALRMLREERLEPWVHNKTIQKARESLRISGEMKEMLRGMRRG